MLVRVVNYEVRKKAQAKKSLKPLRLASHYAELPRNAGKGLPRLTSRSEPLGK